MKRILVVGAAVVDFVYYMDELPSWPEKYRCNDARIIGGGMAANAAVAIAKLGGVPLLASRLGDDAIGTMIEGELGEFGVNLEYLQQTIDAKSAFSSVYIDASGERQIVNFRGSNLQNTPRFQEKISPCDAVLVDTRWVEGAACALRLARTWGVPGILDGEPPIDDGLLSLASHICLPKQGLESIESGADLVASLRKAQSRYSGFFCVTDGANGVTYCTNDGDVGLVGAFRVDVVDTNGCGDIWHGAFALRVALGDDTMRAIVYANAAAACKCRAVGARKACPDSNMVYELLKENGIERDQPTNTR